MSSAFALQVADNRRRLLGMGFQLTLDLAREHLFDERPYALPESFMRWRTRLSQP